MVASLPVDGQYRSLKLAMMVRFLLWIFLVCAFGHLTKVSWYPKITVGHKYFWKFFTQHPGLIYVTGGEATNWSVGVRGQGQKLGSDNWLYGHKAWKEGELKPTCNGSTVYSKRNAHLIPNFLWPPWGRGVKNPHGLLCKKWTPPLHNQRCELLAPLPQVGHKRIQN